MSIEKRNSRFKKMLGVAAMAIELNACVPVNPSQNPQNSLNASTEEVGRRVCKALGPGKHKNALMEIECYDPQGFGVFKRNSDGLVISDELFDMPTTEQLTEQQLEKYIQGKRIILAGELHDKANDSAIFIRLIPAFKKAGFTHIGIEIDEYNQPLIDKYYQTHDEQEASEVLSGYGAEKELWNIVKNAKENGLKVVCFDYRPHKKHKQFPKEEWWEKWWTFRDEQMFLNIEKVLNEPSNRVALFIGKAHVTSKSETDEIYGQDENGFPREIHTDKPLGYRLVNKYDTKNVGLIDFSGCSHTSPFTYACVKEKAEN